LPEQKKSSGRISSKKLSNLKVVVLCIAAATTFWILNALNKDNYTTIVDYPIQWDFNTEKFVAVEPLPESVTIQISGNGWDLLRKYFQLNEPPFVINLVDPSTRNYILTSDLKRPLGDFITPTTLIGLLEDSISYRIDQIETRKLIPELDTTSYSFGKNIEIDGEVTFEPQFIELQGPSSLLDSFDGKYLVSLNGKRITRNYNESVPLRVQNDLKDLLQLNEERIEVNLSVIQYLEGNKRLKINKINFPKSVKLENEDLRPLASYLVDGSKVTELKDIEFEAIIDYGKRNREDSTITIAIRPNPNFIKEVKIDPPFVRLKYE
jgi:hypothetical protein